MVLTPEAPARVVLAVAQRLARARSCWGSLERVDYVGAACLRYYEVLARGPSAWRNFHGYMIAQMRGAMLELARQESRHHGYVRPVRNAPPVVQGRSKILGSMAQRERTRRRAAQRRAHNRSYYVRHHGLQACELCGTFVERGHGARRCDAHVSPRVLAQRRRRARWAAA